MTISLHMVTIKRNSKGVLCKGVRSSGVRYAYYAKLLDTLIVDFEMNCSEIQHALEHKRLRLAHNLFTRLSIRGSHVLFTSQKVTRD